MLSNGDDSAYRIDSFKMNSYRGNKDNGREEDRDREKNTHTHTQRERKPQKETDRQTDRQTQKEKQKQTGHGRNDRELGLGPSPYFPIRAVVDSPIKRAFPTLLLLSLSLLSSSSSHFLSCFSFASFLLFVSRS